MSRDDSALSGRLGPALFTADAGPGLGRSPARPVAVSARSPQSPAQRALRRDPFSPRASPRGVRATPLGALFITRRPAGRARGPGPRARDTPLGALCPVRAGRGLTRGTCHVSAPARLARPAAAPERPSGRLRPRQRRRRRIRRRRKSPRVGSGDGLGHALGAAPRTAAVRRRRRAGRCCATESCVCWAGACRRTRVAAWSRARLGRLDRLDRLRS